MWLVSSEIPLLRLASAAQEFFNPATAAPRVRVLDLTSRTRHPNSAMWYHIPHRFSNSGSKLSSVSSEPISGQRSERDSGETYTLAGPLIRCRAAIGTAPSFARGMFGAVACTIQFCMCALIHATCHTVPVLIAPAPPAQTG